MKKNQFKSALSAIAKLILICCTTIQVACSQTNTNQTVSISKEEQRFVSFMESQSSILDSLLPQRYVERGEFNIKFMGKWNDLSSEHEAVVYNYHLKRIERLKSFDTTQLSEFALTQYQILKFESQLAIEGKKFQTISNAYSANHFYSIPSDLMSSLHSKQRISNSEEALAFINKLKGVPLLFRQITNKIEDSRKNKIVAPESDIKKAIEKYRKIDSNILNGKSITNIDIDSLFVSKKFSNAESLKQSALKVLKDSVATSYNRLADYLETKLLPESPKEIGLYQYEGGKDYYKHLLKLQTSLNIEPDDIIFLGMCLLNRNEQEVTAMKDTMGLESLDLQSFFNFYRNSGGVSSDAMKFLMENQAKEMANLWSKLFDIEIPSAQIVFDQFEERAREEIDFTQTPPRAYFYLNPNYKAEDNQYFYWDMLELLAHEGIPGHGLEQLYTNSLQLPKFRKNFAFNAYLEGWAMYAEYLPKEIGFYKRKDDEFGRYASMLFRACRLVVDASIHTGKMTSEQATQFLLDHSPYPKGMVESQVLRYTAMPAQATCYYIGANYFWNLRSYAEIKLGNKFNIKAFHSEVLKNGNVPLEILKTKINSWIEKEAQTKTSQSFKSTFKYCTWEEARKFLSTPDYFTKKLSEFDLSARMKSLSKVSTAQFLKFAGSCALEWDKSEKGMVNKPLQNLIPKLQKLKIILPEEILLIKSTGKEEGGKAYTRRNAIIIPQEYLRNKTESEIEELILHEMWHIVSRFNPELSYQLYKILGFPKCEVKFPDSLATRLVTNPDAIDYNICFETKMGTTEIVVAPFLYSISQYDDSTKQKEFFNYIHSVIQAKAKDYEAKMVPSLMEVGGKNRILNAWDVENFNPVYFGTRYLIHPEEICAEHFVRIMQGDFSYPFTYSLAKALFEYNSH